MGSYWDGVKRRWAGMVDGPAPRQGTGGSSSGSGSSGTGSGSSGTGSGGGGLPGKEWQLIYQKFRQMVGRDPYSFQELQDWWSRM